MSNTEDLAGRESPFKTNTDRDLSVTPSTGSNLPSTLPTRQDSFHTPSTYGQAEISGNSRVHQGDTHHNNHNNIHIDKLVQEFRLPYEIITQGTYNAFQRQRLAPLNTNYNYVGDANRGRDRRRGHRDNSPHRHDFSRSSPRSSSRSSSSTRYSRSAFSHRGRRRSSVSRDRRQNDYPTPVSSVASSGNSMLSFKEEAAMLLPNQYIRQPVLIPRQLDRHNSVPWNDTKASHEGSAAKNPPNPASPINSSPVIDMTVSPDKDDNGLSPFAEVRKALQNALRALTAMEELNENGTRRDRKKSH